MYIQSICSSMFGLLTGSSIWELQCAEDSRLLRLQCADGSFLFSPALTHGLEQTEDKRCLQYIERIVKKFNGGVSNVYPIDLFEHVWSVDQLEHLGVARHFESEIKDCMGYVHRYLIKVGICWARNSEVQDVDDKAMGVRLIRLHGYGVSQSEQAVAGIFNLHRANQVMIPGEKILIRMGEEVFIPIPEGKAGCKSS